MERDAAAITRERLRKDLFESASGLAPNERIPFLENRTDGDRELMESVLRLFEAGEASSSGPLDVPLAPARAARMPVRFGAYEVIRPLGEGGMGSVYLCSRPDDSGLFAAKVIRGPIVEDEFVERFERERAILDSLHHPKVCRLLDAGAVDGEPFIIMEYIDGTPLTDFCDQSNYSLRQRVELFSQILDPVEYFHRRGVIHRDLKPSNILVTEEGLIKILDFGIAKVTEAPPGQTGLGITLTKEAVLTLRYASPEQIQRRTSGRSSDIYSLGVILYELLTKRHPFQREMKQGVIALLRAQQRQVPAPPSLMSLGRPAGTFRSQASRDQFMAGIDRLAASALRHDPQDRYRSAGQFLDDVRRCLENT